MNGKNKAKSKLQAEQFENEMEPQCITSIQNYWFEGAKVITNQIFDCMQQRKKARIVLDYDPQRGTTRITTYCSPQE